MNRTPPAAQCPGGDAVTSYGPEEPVPTSETLLLNVSEASWKRHQIPGERGSALGAVEDGHTQVLPRPGRVVTRH